MMSFHEKSTWITLAGLLLALGWHGFSLWSLGPAVTSGGIIKTVFGFVIVVSAGHVLVAGFGAREGDTKDERDRAVDAGTDKISDLALSAVIVGILGVSLVRGDWLVANVAFFGLFGATAFKHLVMVVLCRRSA